jgi:hypothetical protein
MFCPFPALYRVPNEQDPNTSRNSKSFLPKCTVAKVVKWIIRTSVEFSMQFEY